MINLGKTYIRVSVGQLDGVEASGVGGERIHPRQNREEINLLNTSQGSRQDSKKRPSTTRQWAGAVLRAGR